MADKHFYAELNEAVDATLRVVQAASYQTVLKATAEILEAAGHFAQALGDDDEHFNVLVADCQRVFEERIRPLDLPGVPNWAEHFVDGFLKDAIRPALEAARGK